MASTGPKKPRTTTGGMRQRAWWVIRVRGMVTMQMLLSAISDGTEKAAQSNISRYIKALERAGFVRRLDQRAPGRGPTSSGFLRYQLVRNNGRLAPVYRQNAGEVFDPNTGEVFKLKGDGDE